jgi:predicted nucleotidyltransferase component of viral defense system
MTAASKNVVASVLARLRNVAESGGLSFNDILQSYVIERFLARLARSPYADEVLLKGALMLRVWGVPRARPTMDIDLLRRGVADQASLVQLVANCAVMEDVSDGVIFDPATIVVEAIREDTNYGGTRIRLQARMGNVRQTVQIDFGVGDAVHPHPKTVDYPVLLGGMPVRLNAYPMETSVAEKFHAMVDLDMQNSRMKDFYDIWVLSRTIDFSGNELSEAIRLTFERRMTPLPREMPTALTARFCESDQHVRQWSAFARRIGQKELVDAFPQVITDLSAFLMPPVKSAAAAESYNAHWLPQLGAWQNAEQRMPHAPVDER